MPSAEKAGDALQADLLQGVSRTFALTIPQLPVQLSRVVSNAYLLCRIVDTIEDEVNLTADQKRSFCTGFIDVLENGADAECFSSELAALLSDQTLAAEHRLIRSIPHVVGVTRQFDRVQQDALTCCVKTMANGMWKFQAQQLNAGLEDLPTLNRYCYYVAGCVGEMLTRLFCHYSPEIARNGRGLFTRAAAFGQGLQMTNILKDIWDDLERGVCWLPRDIFSQAGYDLARLTPHHHDARFCAGLRQLVTIAHGYLQEALNYTLLIPRKETGIRHFCLWAIGMAVLTLQKIRRQLDFHDSRQVKISRRSVRATILASKISVRHDALLKMAFQAASIGV
jgi:farnesyl-diphosphate farnesyltransferase